MAQHLNRICMSEIKLAVCPCVHRNHIYLLTRPITTTHVRCNWSQANPPIRFLFISFGLPSAEHTWLDTSVKKESFPVTIVMPIFDVQTHSLAITCTLDFTRDQFPSMYWWLHIFCFQTSDVLQWHYYYYYVLPIEALFALILHFFFLVWQIGMNFDTLYAVRDEKFDYFIEKSQVAHSDFFVRLIFRLLSPTTYGKFSLLFAVDSVTTFVLLSSSCCHLHLKFYFLCVCVSTSDYDWSKLYKICFFFFRFWFNRPSLDRHQTASMFLIVFSLDFYQKAFFLHP